MEHTVRAFKLIHKCFIGGDSSHIHQNNLMQSDFSELILFIYSNMHYSKSLAHFLPLLAQANLYVAAELFIKVFVYVFFLLSPVFVLDVERPTKSERSGTVWDGRGLLGNTYTVCPDQWREAVVSR